MDLRIDGYHISPRVGQTLLELIRELGLDSNALSARPLAAKIAGEVFTLNYVPVREKDIQERPTIRRAMQASGGEVHLLTIREEAGREVYTRTAQFVIFLAIRELWPRAMAKISCTLGNSVYVQVEEAEGSI